MECRGVIFGVMRLPDIYVAKLLWATVTRVYLPMFRGGMSIKCALVAEAARTEFATKIHGLYGGITVFRAMLIQGTMAIDASVT